jgi:hypothetical protein
MPKPDPRLPRSTRGRVCATAGWVALAVAALFVRLHGFGGESFWVDEIFSARIIEGPIAEILHRIPADKPPLDYYLQALAHSLGPPEVSHRLPALLASVLILFGVWYWGSRALGRRVGMLAAVLAAFHFMVLYHAREARPYAMLMAFAAWQQGIFWAWWLQTGSVANRTPPPRAVSWLFLVGMGALNLLLLLTMYSALILLAAELLTLLIAPGLLGRKNGPAPGGSGGILARPAAQFMAAAAAALVPVGVLLWGRARMRPPEDYFFRFQEFDVWEWLTLASHSLVWTHERLPTAAAALAAMGLLGLGLYRAWGLCRGVALHLALGSVLPLFALPLFYAFIDRQYITRYAAFCIPGCCIVFALGIQQAGRLAMRCARDRPVRVRVRGARAVVAALTLAFIALSVSVLYSVRPSRTDWRRAARQVAESFEPADVVVVPGFLAEVSMGYYLRRLLGTDSAVVTQKEFSARGEVGGRVWMVSESIGRSASYPGLRAVTVELQRAGTEMDAETIARLAATLGDPPTVRMDAIPGPLLGEGWSLPESWGAGTSVRWAVRRRSVVYFPLKETEAGRLTVAVFPHSYEGAPVQTVTAVVNGRTLEIRAAPPGAWTILEWQVAAADIHTGLNEIALEFGHIRSPSELKKNYEDFRTLAAAVEYIQYRIEKP